MELLCHPLLAVIKNKVNFLDIMIIKNIINSSNINSNVNGNSDSKSNSVSSNNINNNYSEGYPEASRQQYMLFVLDIDEVMLCCLFASLVDHTFEAFSIITS